MGSLPRKGNGYGKGTFVETQLFLSDAFLSLGQRGSSPIVSSVSLQLLIMLLGKRTFSKGKDKKGSRVVPIRTDSNQFTLTYPEITAYGSRIDKQGKRVKGMITQPQVTRAFDELLAKGFIEIIEYGGAFEKHKSVYALSDDYKQWRWGDPPIKSRRRDFRRGYQGAGKGAVQSKIAHTDVTTHTPINV